jgi:hypothetical protein
VTDQRLDAIRVLLERKALGREKHPCAESLRTFLERGLEDILRQENAYRRTDVANAFVEVRNVVGRRDPSQRLDADHTASCTNCASDFARTTCSRPTLRKISIVRWVTEAARGWIAVPR